MYSLNVLMMNSISSSNAIGSFKGLSTFVSFVPMMTFLCHGTAQLGLYFSGGMFSTIQSLYAAMDEYTLAFSSEQSPV